MNSAEKERLTIQDTYYLESIEQLEAISDPIRFRMYSLMIEPKTGAQLARALGISRARAHYHLRILKECGLAVFHGKGMSHGITEKYYRLIALNLDFSNLIPKNHHGVIPNEITLRSFQAASQFIATILDVSRERITKLQVHDRVGIGYHYTLEPRLSPEQFQQIKDDLARLKDRVVEMNRENMDAGESQSLVDCGLTLFLTPLSSQAGVEPGDTANNES